MADSLPARILSTSRLAQQPKVQQFYLAGVSQGLSINQMAAKASKGDKSKHQLWYWTFINVANQPEIHNIVELVGQSHLRSGIAPITETLVRRAKKGRVDAAKLALEASGFHNPRVQHEHSGDIQVTINMPRPPREVEAGPVVDADVVEPE